MHFNEIESTEDVIPFLDDNIENKDLLITVKYFLYEMIQKLIAFRSENPNEYSNFQIREAVMKGDDKEYSGYSFMFFTGDDKEGVFLTVENCEINGYMLMDKTTQEEIVKIH